MIKATEESVHKTIIVNAKCKNESEYWSKFSTVYQIKVVEQSRQQDTMSSF